MTDRPPPPGPILIVDDDRMITAMLTDALADTGCEVLSATSAEEAQALLARRPMLAFLDLNLPQVTGDEICRRIRQTPDLGDMPVVMITADERTEIIQRCLVAGADDFLPKPLRAEQVQAKVIAVREGLSTPPRQRAERKKVLLATRNEFFRTVVSRLLASSGIDLSYAQSALEITDKAKGHHGALVDLDVPDVTPELAGRLKAEAPQTWVVWLASRQSIAARRAGRAAHTPLAWAALAPYDLETERDEALRHLNRLLTAPGLAQMPKRRPRVSYYSAVRYRAVGAADWWVGCGFDLSDGGIFIRTLTPFSGVQRNLEVSFQLGRAAPPSRRRAWSSGPTTSGRATSPPRRPAWACRSPTSRRSSGTSCASGSPSG